MATRNLGQKKAGTIAYQLKEKHDLRGEASEENPAIAVTVVGSRTVTTKELAKEIAASCTIKEADVAGVLTALSQRIQRTLLNGDRVELGDIGTLSVTLTCGNKHRASDRKLHNSLSASVGVKLAEMLCALALTVDADGSKSSDTRLFLNRSYLKARLVLAMLIVLAKMLAGKEYHSKSLNVIFIYRRIKYYSHLFFFPLSLKVIF